MDVATFARTMICPTCRQDVVPIVRGVRAYCTACGAQMPVAAAGEAINVVGQPARVGGGIARVLGWLILAGGAVGAGFFAFIALLFTTSIPLYVSAFISVVALAFALPILFAGKSLRKAGEARELAAKERALQALAAKERGVLTVPGVARALEIKDEDADALLTDLAKRPDGKVSLEVDDQGGITYVFRDMLVGAAPPARVRVGGEGWRVPPPAEAKPRVIDAELIEEEEASADPARRQMRR